MNFGPYHYVPVLKVKQGEKQALGLIAEAVRRHVTPLLEIVERKEDKKPTVSAHLDTAFKGLADAVGPYNRCFLDAREIAPDGPAGAAEVFGRAVADGIAFTPVTGISREADVGPALNHRDRGLALRLTREDLERGGMAGRLVKFISTHKLEPEDVDLILDMGSIEVMIPEGVAALGRAFVEEVPKPARWRTLTLSGSAFPRGMGIVQRKSHAFVERAEWLAWKNHLLPHQGELPRLPTFSDCAIQHPEGVEGFIPGLMKGSATIRYALSEAWLLIKGESTGRTLPSKQFPGLAKQLVYGGLREHFRGSDHCAGCASIKDSADGMPRLGSLGVWRRIGTVHHITQTVQDLRSLLGS